MPYPPTVIFLSNGTASSCLLTPGLLCLFFHVENDPNAGTHVGLFVSVTWFYLLSSAATNVCSFMGWTEEKESSCSC